MTELLTRVRSAVKLDRISEGITWLQYHPVLAAVVWIFGPSANTYYENVSFNSKYFLNSLELNEDRENDRKSIRRAASFTNDLQAQAEGDPSPSQHVSYIESLHADRDRSHSHEISPQWGWYIYISPNHSQYVSN